MHLLIKDSYTFAPSDSIFFVPASVIHMHEQTYYYSHWQMKWLTLFISSAQHLGWSYLKASEHFVLKVALLEVWGKNGQGIRCIMGKKANRERQSEVFCWETLHHAMLMLLLTFWRWCVPLLGSNIPWWRLYLWDKITHIDASPWLLRTKHRKKHQRPAQLKKLLLKWGKCASDHLFISLQMP